MGNGFSGPGIFALKENAAVAYFGTYGHLLAVSVVIKDIRVLFAAAGDITKEGQNKRLRASGFSGSIWTDKKGKAVNVLGEGKAFDVLS